MNVSGMTYSLDRSRVLVLSPSAGQTPTARPSHGGPMEDQPTLVGSDGDQSQIGGKLCLLFGVLVLMTPKCIYPVLLVRGNSLFVANAGGVLNFHLRCGKCQGSSGEISRLRINLGSPLILNEQSRVETHEKYSNECVLVGECTRSVAVELSCWAVC